MAILVCPADCTNLLPAWSFRDCSPELESSEIVKIAIGKPGNPLEPAAAPAPDVITAAIWNGRLAATDDKKIVEIVCVGDMPLPQGGGEATMIQGYKGKIQLASLLTYTLNFTIQQTPNANWQAMRQMSCGGTYLLWFVTASGQHLYGAREGITCSIQMNPIFGRGDNAIVQIEATATWKSKTATDRIPNPLA